MKKTNRMKLGALVLFMCICATIMMAGCSSETMGHWFSGGNIVINEVVTSNSASLLDDVYGSPDWIELYNKGTTDVNLENYALSNDLNSPAKYLFPNVTLKAGNTWWFMRPSKLRARRKINCAPDLSFPPKERC